ncbi:hypothetical protein AN948_13955 [Rhodococcus sp. ADH]|nr:hypothetical protein AN948_13955 [Rhodococcus sp. ADH]KSU75693.1 hypothetical protein AS032_18195 [Rhodococcus qingshengii]SCC47179.1 hypothetical protein GA0061093_109226 [Rhodococcus qingshengii]
MLVTLLSAWAAASIFDATSPLVPADKSGELFAVGVSRWEVAVTGGAEAEAGPNAGPNYVVARCAISGTKLADYPTIRRTDGRASFGVPRYATLTPRRAD